MTGMREAESNRSNAQWYDPWDLLGLGKLVASFTVPLRIADYQSRVQIGLELIVGNGGLWAV